MTFRSLSLLLVALLISCNGPSQHDETRYGVVTVAFGPSLDGSLDWRQDQRQQLVEELALLAALGPTFQEASEGSAQLVVRPFDSGANCAAGVGRWTTGTSFVEVDPACTAGYLELRAAVGHEIGHALHLRHVCRHIDETSDCSPVGYGVALMNPKVSYGDVLDQADGQTGVAQDAPTELDLAEWRLNHP